MGVDGAGRLGWVGIVIDDGGFQSAEIGADLSLLVQRAGRLDAIGVDIPIGLVDGPSRSADVAARRFVGPARRASVFPAPPRCVLDADDYATANALLGGRGLPKLSRQAFALLAGIRQAAALAQVQEVVEVFPEATFRSLAGHNLAWYKKSWAGSIQRRELLAGADPSVVVPPNLGPAGVAPTDDVLDAAAVAWSALRYASGQAQPLGDPDEVDHDTGRRIAIWV
ncbi:MAG: DUF429 domain-containing protein [Acidimicrobiales bacterium]